MLLEHAGQVVSREELQKTLWPADTFVDFDHGLNKAINKIREALGDSAESAAFRRDRRPPRLSLHRRRQGGRCSAASEPGRRIGSLNPGVDARDRDAGAGCARNAAISLRRSRAWAFAALALIVLLGSLAVWRALFEQP